jgi:hypothetical protein
MSSPLRTLARRLLGVVRTPTYYLPWLTRPGLTCTLLLHNVEARFKPGCNVGPFPVVATQHDADGTVVRRYQIDLPDSTSAVELALQPTADGCGFVTVAGERVHSDLFVTLSDGHDYTVTHGRGEFVEHYPARARAVLRMLGPLLALVGRTIPAFARDQYLYAGSESRSHLLLMNLSNVPNRIRVTVSGGGTALGARLVTLPPMGSRLLDTTELAATPGRGTVVRRARLEGNAWFNLYLVGAGPRDLAGPLSLMHVK